MSATIAALEDEALLVCHLIIEFRSQIDDAVRNRVGITPSRGSGIFAQKNNRETRRLKTPGASSVECLPNVFVIRAPIGNRADTAEFQPCASTFGLFLLS